MKARRLRCSHSLNAFQMLSKGKREMERQKEYEKIEATLLYLNNAFNNNIQFQQIFIDIYKGKSKSIRSKELKEMYKLFSQNKASMCLFERLVYQSVEKLKTEKTMEETALSTKSTKHVIGLEIMKEQQVVIKANIKTNNNLLNQKQSDSQLNTDRTVQKNKGQRSSINSKCSQTENNQKELQFLLSRVYCRLIEKILVKIAFYNMNNKFLDFISLNMLDLTKNLQIMIRRLQNIKDLKPLQQIVFKVYRQNFLIENKILEMLVDGGYILSIDQFYRINGVDIDHKDVYERNSAIDQIELNPIGQNKMNIQEKTLQMKDKKDKENVVKKKHFDRTNNQINQKYLLCVSQIKTNLDQEDEKNKKDNEKLSNHHYSMSKTQSILRKPQKISRFSSKIVNNTIEAKEENLRYSQESLQSSLSFADIIPQIKLKNKKIFHHSSRISNFSPQFSKLIKQSSQSPLMLHKNSKILSDKFCNLNELEKKSWNKSTNGCESLNVKTSLKIQRKKSEKILGTFPINKLLKLCQFRNSCRYNVKDIVKQDIMLQNDVEQCLKKKLLKPNHFYDPNQKEQSNFASEVQVLNSMKKKISTDSKSYHKQINDQDFTERAQQSKVKPYEETQIEEIQTFPAQNYNKIIDKNEDLEKDICYPTQQSEEKKKQWNQVKFYKDSHIGIESIQRIASKNNTIFTACGVRNLVDGLEEYARLRKQKIKRISYLKIKQKLTKSNVSSNQTSTFWKKQNPAYKSNNSRHKKYQNGSQQIVGDMIQKTVEKLINQSIQINNLQPLVTCQIYNKVNSLNKVSTRYENMTFKQRRKRVDRFQTLNPRFLNDDYGAVEQKKSCFKRKQKLKTTTYYHSNSEPLSPVHSSNKENIIGSYYEVYDVRKRKKLPN